MYIKVIQPQKDGNKIYSNTGTVTNLINYLTGQIADSKEVFFDEYNENICAEKVINEIDKNGNYTKNKEKFFSIIISPSEEELLHINNDSLLLKTYNRQIMRNYADAFSLPGQKIDSQDLLWYATIHKDREIKNIDLNTSRFLSLKEAKHISSLLKSSNPRDRQEVNKILMQANHREKKKYKIDHFKVGDKKPGFHQHIHIVVSRLDKSRQIELNPRYRQKYFNIKSFIAKSAKDFQTMFNYPHETLSQRFNEKYSEKEKGAFRKQIAYTTEQINEKLGSYKLSPQKLQKIGEECSFSRAYFINLTKLKYRLAQGDYTIDPYYFVAHGRDMKFDEFVNKKMDEHKEGNILLQDQRLDDKQVINSNSHRVGEESTLKLFKALGSVQTGMDSIQETLKLDTERKKSKRSQSQTKEDGLSQ